MTDDPAMENMFDQIEYENFKNRTEKTIDKVNQTGKLPWGMNLKVDPSAEVDIEQGIFYCEARLPSAQQIENENKILAKKIQAVTVKADETLERRKEVFKKLGVQKTSTRHTSPVVTEGKKQLREWVKQQQIQDELIKEKLYPLREWAKRMNP